MDSPHLGRAARALRARVAGDAGRYRRLRRSPRRCGHLDARHGVVLCGRHGARGVAARLSSGARQSARLGVPQRGLVRAHPGLWRARDRHGSARCRTPMATPEFTGVGRYHRAAGGGGVAELRHASRGDELPVAGRGGALGDPVARHPAPERSGRRRLDSGAAIGSARARLSGARHRAAVDRDVVRARGAVGGAHGGHGLSVSARDRRAQASQLLVGAGDEPGRGRRGARHRPTDGEGHTGAPVSFDIALRTRPRCSRGAVGHQPSSGLGPYGRSRVGGRPRGLRVRQHTEPEQVRLYVPRRHLRRGARS